MLNYNIVIEEFGLAIKKLNIIMAIS